MFQILTHIINSLPCLNKQYALFNLFCIFLSLCPVTCTFYHYSIIYLFLDNSATAVWSHYQKYKISCSNQLVGVLFEVKSPPPPRTKQRKKCLAQGHDLQSSTLPVSHYTSPELFAWHYTGKCCSPDWYAFVVIPYMSFDMRFPTMWYVWPAKTQISLRIHAVWSEPLIVAWIFYDC